MCLDANDVSGIFRIIYMFLENISNHWTEGDCVPISVEDILVINRSPLHFIANPDFSREIPDFSQNFFFWFKVLFLGFRVSGFGFFY